MKGPLPTGLAPQPWVFGTPEPNLRTQSATPQETVPLGGSIDHSGRENQEGNPEPPVTFGGLLYTNPEAHAHPPRTLTSARIARLYRQQIGPVGLLGLHPNPRSAAGWGEPSPGAWHQAQGIGDT